MRILVEAVRKKTEIILMDSGLEKGQAEIVADALVESEICGITTHGLKMLPAHLERICNGGYNLNPQIRALKEMPAFAVMDADNAIGMVSAHYCMEYAIKRAEVSGIYVVFARNCNTYSAAFYYAEMAAKQGMIGITFCNAPSAMAAYGGTEKMLGTNPLAVAIPGKNQGSFVFDMATSIVAKSKIGQAMKQGEEIPLNWALDEEGNPTTDPLKAIRGSILPMAGAKGYGLSMAIDMLSGVLSGASYLNHVGKFYDENHSCMNVGQVFIVINPKQIYGNDFYDEMDEYIKEVYQSGNEERKIRIPGDNKRKNRDEALKNGVEIPIELEKMFL